MKALLIALVLALAPIPAAAHMWVCAWFEADTTAGTDTRVIVRSFGATTTPVILYFSSLDGSTIYGGPQAGVVPAFGATVFRASAATPPGFTAGVVEVYSANALSPDLHAYVWIDGQSPVFCPKVQ